MADVIVTNRRLLRLLSFSLIDVSVADDVPVLEVGSDGSTITVQGRDGFGGVPLRSGLVARTLCFKMDDLSPQLGHSAVFNNKVR